MGCKYFLNPQSALPPKGNTPRSTSIDFVENQLSPSLIGLSPLTTGHLRLLQQTQFGPPPILLGVQPSMVRSPVSAPSDNTLY